MNLYIFLIALIVCLLSNVNSIIFHLPPNSKRCLKEKIHKGVLVEGEYSLSDAPGQKTGLIITDSKGHNIVVRDAIYKGMFAFITDDCDLYKICFISKMPSGQTGMVRKATFTIKKKSAHPAVGKK